MLSIINYLIIIFYNYTAYEFKTRKSTSYEIQEMLIYVIHQLMYTNEN